MGENCGLWFPRQHLDGQAPDLDNYDDSRDLGQQKSVPLYSNSGNDMVFAIRSLAEQKSSEVSQQNFGQSREACGCFYPLPRFRQDFAPATYFHRGRHFSEPHENFIRPASADIHSEKILTDPPENCGEVGINNVGATGKNFLVFDHSPDQTTMIFSSGIQTPSPYLTSWSPKLPSTYNVNVGLDGAKEEFNHLSIPDLTDDLDDDHKTHLQCEMREDTEELNALLYSDDDSDTEDDEFTSTGHSPCVMTASDNDDCFNGSREELDTSLGSTKKRKTIEGGHDYTPPPGDSSYSAKYRKINELEDDAQSSCGNGKNLGFDETKSSENKRMHMDKIRETARILQKIIPDGEGKDAIMVLDEAILYLKSLKTKAKALGLSSL